MTTFAKLCFASLITACMVPSVTLAYQTPAPVQEPSTPPQPINNQPDTSPKAHQPRPNPDASGKYHAGDGVTAPKLVYSAQPEFPKKMRFPSVDRCTVGMTIDTDGKPIDVHILPSSKSVDNGNLAIDTRMMCINTVQQYRFKPATFQGKPIPIDLIVEINFQDRTPR
jgi:hypothetical protein